MEAPSVDLLEHVVGRIKLSTEGFNHEYDYGYATGKKKNLKVSVNQNSLRVMGSLSKYYYDDPSKTFNLADTCKAIEQLSDEFELDLSKAQLRRIDVADNFEMNYTPKAYYEHLGSLQYFDRKAVKSTLYYSNETRVLCFYNKIAELKYHKAPVPKCWAGENVLRYELRYLKPTKSFNHKIYGADLYNPSFFGQLVDNWYDQFGKIQKITPFDFDLSKINKPKKLDQYVMAFGIQQNGGLLWIEKIIKQLRYLNAFNANSDYSRTKARYRKLFNNSDTGEPDTHLIDELSQKIATAHKRQFIQ